MLQFVYGSSDLNLLRLPFFRNGNDPLEDFDYNGSVCNPIQQPAAARTPSTYAHHTTSCVSNNTSFTPQKVLLGIRIRPRSGSGRTKYSNREAINTKNNSTCINIHRVFQACYLDATCAWLQPVFQEPGASRLIAVVTSIRSTTRSETPSSDCTRSPDEISMIGFSSKN
ncbi:hypothetical protein F511_32285 [Dorcoceras hygrometricum]|uniref:Uncharacterized protein n=1 Tax=Dorcoceras hygrometricum TaxID=472368 RepID=A0A2Z7ABQ0_9LAMI|nr:hypothetical protein F511_32285 [Dorcoceras hygrometricum]